MDITTTLFYIFSSVLLASSLCVIVARSPVFAALFLVLSFFSASCVWMLLHAEFLAITLVLVYVGAVMVLFLFVVMMLDVNVESLRTGFWRHFPIASLVGVAIALEMAAVLLGGFKVTQAPELSGAELAMGNTKLLGIQLYTRYHYTVQIAVVILLVAIIAAIALTLRGRRDTKSMNPGLQVRVKAADRVRLIKMAAVMPETKTATPASGDVA
jgi:NADH-quinone oxidoreductase subunit J